jgi:hypothetical protein
MKKRYYYELEYVKYDDREPRYAVKKSDKLVSAGKMPMPYKTSAKGASVFHTFWVRLDAAVQYAENLTRQAASEKQEAAK